MMLHAMMRTSIGAGLLALLFACDRAASLSVAIEIRDPMVARIDLSVARDPGGENAEVLRCAIVEERVADPGCALESGSRAWSGHGAPVEFWLYGTPKTELEIRVVGHQSPVETIPDVSTSTTVLTRLPAGNGERGRLTFALPPPTLPPAKSAPALRCRAELAMGQTDRTSLLVYDLVPGDDRSEILAASGTELAVLDFVREADGCRLAPSSAFAGRPIPFGCTLWDASLVAGLLDPRDGRLFAGLCNSVPGRPTESRIVAGLITSRDRVELSTFTSSGTRARTSRPVIADPDGTGAPDVFSLWSDGTRVSLVRFDPRRPEVEADRVPLPIRPLANGALTQGPLVVHRGSGRDALVVAGYAGAIVLITGPSPLTVETILPVRTPAIVSPAALARKRGDALELTIAELRADAMTFTQILDHGDRFTLEGQIVVPKPSLMLSTDREARIAIGDVDGTGVASAIVVVAGRAAIFPIAAGAVAREVEIWSGAVSGVQNALLASVDGESGAEIVAFDPTSPLVQGRTVGGRILPGWPLETVQGGTLRLVLGELDPAPDTGHTLEVVALSQRLVEVVSLGVGSFDAASMSWPSVGHDASGSGVLRR